MCMHIYACMQVWFMDKNPADGVRITEFIEKKKEQLNKVAV